MQDIPKTRSTERKAGKGGDGLLFLAYFVIALVLIMFPVFALSYWYLECTLGIALLFGFLGGMCLLKAVDLLVAFAAVVARVFKKREE